MFNKLYAIAVNTFAETIRQPIYGVLLWSAIGLLILNPAIAAFSMTSGEDIKIMQDVALSTMLLYGLLAAVFSASGVITREIESFTVLTVVSKPVSRPTFLTGKFLGVAAAMAVGYLLLTIVFMLTVRHGVMETATDKFDRPVLVFSTIALGISVAAATFANFTYNWHFSSTLLAFFVPLSGAALTGVLFFDEVFQPQAPWTDFGDLQIVYACLLVFCGVLVLTAAAVALATRFSQVVTLMLCFGIFLLGLLSDYYFGTQQSQSMIYGLFYAVVPNFQYFWTGDALTQDQVIGIGHVGLVTAYAALMVTGLVGVGVAMFQTREVG